MPTRNRARIRKRLPLPRAQPLLPRTEALHSNLLRPNPPRKRQGSRRRRGTRAAPMPEAAMLRRQRRTRLSRRIQRPRRPPSQPPKRKIPAARMPRAQPLRPRQPRRPSRRSQLIRRPRKSRQALTGTHLLLRRRTRTARMPPVPAPLRPKPIRLSRPSRKRLAQPPLRLLKQQGRRLRAPLNRVERKGQPLRCPRPKHRQKRRIRATPMSCRTLPPTLLQQARPA